MKPPKKLGRGKGHILLLLPAPSSFLQPSWCVISCTFSSKVKSHWVKKVCSLEGLIMVLYLQLSLKQLTERGCKLLKCCWETTGLLGYDPPNICGCEGKPEATHTAFNLKQRKNYKAYFNFVFTLLIFFQITSQAASLSEVNYMSRLLTV